MGIDRATLDQLAHLLRPLSTRIASMVSRAVVQLVDDGPKLQSLQVGVPEPRPDAEHFQPYGFFSVPFPGAEAVVIFPNGDRSHPLVLVASDRRYRPTDGQLGEAGLATDEGDEIRLARGHAIVLTSSGTIQLGSNSAADGAIKGNQRDSAEQTFLTALNAYVTAIKATADPTNAATPAMTAAITAFKTAITAAISSKVKVE